MSKPLIGWKACESRFYLDAMPITAAEAVRHWDNKTATFLPNAAKIVRDGNAMAADFIAMVEGKLNQ